MPKKYTHYTADQLLNDDYFIQSQLHPTKTDRAFWDALEKENEQLAKEIQLARMVLKHVKGNNAAPILSEKSEKELWERIQVINREYANKWSQRKQFILTFSAGIAATVAILLVTNLIKDLYTPTKTTDYTAIIESAEKQVDDSGNIQLVLSNNQKLNLHGKESQIEYEKKGEIRINSEKVELAEKEKLDEAFNTLVVPVGKRSHLTLADGTKIWVNSDSKVIYPVQFGKKQREIFVEGEIYLDVNPHKEVPFILKTRDSEVTVLGTEFNVTAYENELKTDIVLVTGKVEVKLPGNQKATLTPNQLISYDAETNKSHISQVDITNYTSWKDGYYQFRRETMDIVLKKVAKYYGMRMTWDKEVGYLVCSGKLDLKDDPEEVLSALEKAAPIEIARNSEIVNIVVKP